MIIPDEIKLGVISVVESVRRALGAAPDALFVIVGHRPFIDELGVLGWPGVETYDDLGSWRAVVGRADEFCRCAFATRDTHLHRFASALAPEAGSVSVIAVDAKGYTVTRVRVRLAMLTEGGEA